MFRPSRRANRPRLVLLAPRVAPATLSIFSSIINVQSIISQRGTAAAFVAPTRQRRTAHNGPKEPEEPSELGYQSDDAVPILEEPGVIFGLAESDSKTRQDLLETIAHLEDLPLRTVCNAAVDVYARSLVSSPGIVSQMYEEMKHLGLTANLYTLEHVAAASVTTGDYRQAYFVLRELNEQKYIPQGEAVFIWVDAYKNLYKNNLASFSKVQAVFLCYPEQPTIDQQQRIDEQKVDVYVTFGKWSLVVETLKTVKLTDIDTWQNFTARVDRHSRYSAELTLYDKIGMLSVHGNLGEALNLLKAQYYIGVVELSKAMTRDLCTLILLACMVRKDANRMNQLLHMMQVRGVDIEKSRKFDKQSILEACAFNGLSRNMVDVMSVVRDIAITPLDAMWCVICY
jgi:hypothetical protein